jgi:uncharacterized protein YjlB
MFVHENVLQMSVALSRTFCSVQPMASSARTIEPSVHLFVDDGTIPNHPRWPLLLYRGAIDLSGTPDPELVIEKTFSTHRWGDMWRNGIYPYAHYHSMIHEALGIARGRARVRFGGDNGEEIELRPGDVAVLPAGTGHQCLWAGPDLCVIGAYPPTGKFDICRGGKADHSKALASIPLVPLPQTDPVYGDGGPLFRHWQP